MAFPAGGAIRLQRSPVSLLQGSVNGFKHVPHGWIGFAGHFRYCFNSARPTGHLGWHFSAGVVVFVNLLDRFRQHPLSFRITGQVAIHGGSNALEFPADQALFSLPTLGQKDFPVAQFQTFAGDIKRSSGETQHVMQQHG